MFLTKMGQIKTTQCFLRPSPTVKLDRSFLSSILSGNPLLFYKFEPKQPWRRLNDNVILKASFRAKVDEISHKNYCLNVLCFIEIYYTTYKGLVYSENIMNNKNKIG